MVWMGCWGWDGLSRGGGVLGVVVGLGVGVVEVDGWWCGGGLWCGVDWDCGWGLRDGCGLELGIGGLLGCCGGLRGC